MRFGRLDFGARAGWLRLLGVVLAGWIGFWGWQAYLAHVDLLAARAANVAEAAAPPCAGNAIQEMECELARGPEDEQGPAERETDAVARLVLGPVALLVLGWIVAGFRRSA